ncbi:hypothetical protein A5692_13275 [Mycobacterium sp. E342]|nr:DUF732 domain-containing protein [Mycobacterium sp. E342]OBH34272.1 hypothetical protein A5692_13275 [Mycobacterium sp. E342]
MGSANEISSKFHRRGSGKVTTSRSRAQVLAAGAAGVVLGAAMFGGAVLSAPHASASCNMSPADDQYIKLLAQNKMVHNADFNDCSEAAEGRWFASQVRANPNPFGEAQELVNMITNTTPMSQKQAEWEVESAIYVYAPDLIPRLKDQAARQVPGQPAPM